MQSGYLRHIFFLITINLIVKPFYVLFIDRGVQNELGTATYGLFFALFNLSYLLYILSDLGIYQYHTRQAAQWTTHQPLQTARIAGAKLWLTGFYLISLLLLAWFLGYQQVLVLVILLGIYQAVVSWVFFIRSLLNGNGLYRQDAWTSVMDRSTLILLIGMILLVPAWRSHFSLTQFVVLLILAMTVTLLTGLLYLRKHAIILRITPGKVKDVWKVVRETMPFALTVILMTLYTRIDGIMLERLATEGAYQAGVYAASYRLLDAANMIAYLVATLLLPMYSRHLEARQEVYPLYRDAFKMLWVISGITSVAAVFFSGPIMQLLYHEANEQWSRVFTWLMPCFISGSIIYVAGTLITASGDLKAMNWAAGISIGINVLLNAILIPYYQAWGAVVATLITQSLMAGALIYITQSRYHLPQARLWTGAIFSLAAWVGIAWLARFLPLSWPVQFACFGFASVLFGGVIGWIPVKSWWDEIRDRRSI